MGEEIPCEYQMLPVDKLKYLKNNPRVYTSIHGKKIPKYNDELQELIDQQMLKESSVKNLIPRIKRDGGLTEPILVRHDTMEVVEGNSRLAVYRLLNRTDKENKGKWDHISCQVVSKLTPKQQYAYLNQVHVEGKTKWVTYEKANQAYIMYKIDNFSEEEVMETLSITTGEFAKRIRVIELMEKNKDGEHSHFSHYNVLVRTRKIAEEIETNPYLENILIEKIKNQGSSSNNEDEFTAQDLRDRLPSIIVKKKTLKKYLDGKSTLYEAYQSARLSGPHQNIKSALEKVLDIEMSEFNTLDKNQLNAALIDVKNLLKKTERIKSKIVKVKN